MEYTKILEEPLFFHVLLKQRNEKKSTCLIDCPGYRKIACGVDWIFKNYDLYVQNFGQLFPKFIGLFVPFNLKISNVCLFV